MSKITLGIIAAASAATGAAATAFYLGTQPKSTTAAAAAVPAAGIASKHPVRRKPDEGGPSPVDPSGLFKYGEWATAQCL